ncbi:hypothetical protein J3R83DRAFT_9174 [Lanmaoa asiatica]|nr:hypothetical protein J3R83DRAFT_9174 [Lanmaoa asiatica]
MARHTPLLSSGSLLARDFVFTLVFVNPYPRHFVFHTFIFFDLFALSVAICVSISYLRSWFISVISSYLSCFHLYFNKN